MSERHAEFDRFVAKVRAMRERQTAYFKTRDRGALVASKEAEREVDALVEAHAGPKEPPAQGGLFPDRIGR